MSENVLKNISIRTLGEVWVRSMPIKHAWLDAARIMDRINKITAIRKLNNKNTNFK